MRLKFNNLKPLAMAGTLAIGGGVLLYGDIDQYSRISTVAANIKTSSYLKESDRAEFSQVFMKSIFQNLVSDWKINTMFSSSTSQIIDDPNFKNIVAMGASVVPFIIDEIREQPSLLVWALNFIYETKISDASGITIEKACKLWVQHLTQS